MSDICDTILHLIETEIRQDPTLSDVVSDLMIKNGRVYREYYYRGSPLCTMTCREDAVIVRHLIPLSTWSVDQKLEISNPHLIDNIKIIIAQFRDNALPRRN